MVVHQDYLGKQLALEHRRDEVDETAVERVRALVRRLAERHAPDDPGAVAQAVLVVLGLDAT